ncbi:BRO family protein [Streptomyces sp. NPDC003299]
MSTVQLPSIFRAVQEIFPDTILRTGFSTCEQAAFLVTADLAKGVGYKADAESFVRSLAKGPGNSRTLYVGDEVIQTAGGPQRMKVIYKRGVFHLLATSRLPKAAEFRDQVFDLLEQIEREGFVVNADTPLAQLQTMPQRVAQAVDELMALRELEIRDYRRIRHALYEAGGDRDDYQDIRNLIYEALFGKTAEEIRQTQVQVNGPRYVRDYRHPRTGKLHKAGELRPSTVARDFLDEQQLKTLDSAILWITSTLTLRFPGGYATLGDIRDVVKQLKAQRNPVPQPQNKKEPAEVAPIDLDIRARINAVRAKLQGGVR